MRVVIPRFFTLYGPGQKGDFLVPSLLRQMLARGAVTMGDPEPKRDFTYIDDGVDALVAAARVADTSGPVVNVASGRTTSAGEIAQRLAHTLGYHGPIHHDLSRRRVGEIMDFTVDTTRSASLLKWKPTTTLEDGLRRTVEAARRAVSFDDISCIPSSRDPANEPSLAGRPLRCEVGRRQASSDG